MVPLVSYSAVPMLSGSMVLKPGCSSAHSRLYLLSRWALILSPAGLP